MSGTKLDQLIRHAWFQHRELTLGHARVLVEFNAMLRDPRRQPTEEDRAAARHAAHRLAGSLGMFGLVDGGAMAGWLEEHLYSPEAYPMDISEFGSLARALNAIVEQGPDCRVPTTVDGRH
jgi:hypothetical protein